VTPVSDETLFEVADVANPACSFINALPDHSIIINRINNNNISRLSNGQNWWIKVRLFRNRKSSVSRA